MEYVGCRDDCLVFFDVLICGDWDHEVSHKGFEEHRILN